MRGQVHRLRFPATIVIIFLSVMSCCFAQDTNPQIKVAVQTKQGRAIKTAIKTTSNANDKTIAIDIINNESTNQNLHDILVTITPAVLIPDGTPYMKGADQMEAHEGQMIQMVTGKKQKYEHSNMYLMFKRGEEDYLLVGVIAWRTFLCNIITEEGTIKIIGDGDNKEIKAGQKVAFDKVIFMQDKSWQDLQERYAELIAKENNVKAPKKAFWTGWSTWDFYRQAFIPADVETNIEALKKLNVKGNIIQLDGGWWKQRGDYFDVRDNIPGGIKGIIEKIHKAGYKAGLHLDGSRVSKAATVVKDHPDYFLHTEKGDLLEIGKDVVTKDPLLLWDFSNPGAREYIKRVMKNARDNWKADYFKIDFLRQGLIKGVSKLPVTNLERFRMGINAMKEGFGDVYFLACSSNFGSMIGLSDADRTGGDIQPNYEAVKTRVQHTAASYYLHPKIFNLDPDYLVLRSKEESNERDGKKPSLNYDEAAMWANYVSIYGNARFESDNIPLLKPEKKVLIEKTLNMPFFTKTVPMDLWDHYKEYNDAPAFFLAKAENGTVCIALFNWENKDASFTVSGFKQNAAFKDFNGDAQVKMIDGKMRVPLQGVHSVLLRYEGKETFEQLRKQLKVVVTGR